MQDIKNNLFGEKKYSYNTKFWCFFDNAQHLENAMGSQTPINPPKNLKKNDKKSTISKMGMAGLRMRF